MKTTPSKTNTFKKQLIILFLFSSAGIGFNSAGDIYQIIGVPVCLMVTLILIPIFYFNSRNKQHDYSPVLPPDDTQSSDNETQEDMRHIDLSVIGIDYRKKQIATFEQSIDLLLDKCITIILKHIEAHTVAILFPSTATSFSIRRCISKDRNIDKKATIYLGVGIIGSMIKEGIKPFILNDIVTESTTLFYYTKDAQIHSLLFSPIIAADVDRGAIIIDSKEKNYFTQEHQYFVSQIADLCGIAVYHSYLYNQYKLDYERLSALSMTEKMLFQKQNTDAILDNLMRIIPFAFRCDRLCIVMADDPHISETATIKKCWGHYIEELKDLNFSLKEKSLTTVLFSKNICIYRNFATDFYEIRFSSTEQHVHEFRSFIAFPLGVSSCMGMVLMESFWTNAYSESSKDLLSGLISSASIAIEKIQLLQQTEQLAIHDGLTGLYNRRYFQHLLKETTLRARRSKKPLALVMCDIDFFKMVNDQYGHSFGDMILKSLADKLQSSIREGVDHASRYGGEEFCLILADTTQSHACETIERIRELIEQTTFQTPLGEAFYCTMSFGIALFDDRTASQDQLIKWADKALYMAKENGRNRVEIYQFTEEISG